MGQNNSSIGNRGAASSHPVLPSRELDTGIRCLCPKCARTLVPPHMAPVFRCPCGEALSLQHPQTQGFPELPAISPGPAAFLGALRNLPPAGHPLYHQSLYNLAIAARLPIQGGRVDPQALNAFASNLERDRKGDCKRILPFLPVHSWTGAPACRSAEARLCGICMEVYNVGDNLRTLPCLHYFHSNCVDPWLLEKGQCPLCRVDLLQDPGGHIGPAYR